MILINSKIKNILTVQYSGEVYYKDPNLFNINIIPGIHSTKNIITIPLMYMHFYVNNLKFYHLNLCAVASHNSFLLLNIRLPL